MTGVGPSVASANGTVRAIVRLDPVSVPTGASQEETIETMRTSATESQRPLTTFASEREGVTVVQRLWLANAVLVEINTDRVAPDELLGVDNVRAVHKNFEIQVPTNPDGNTSSGDGSPVRTTAGGSPGVDTTWGLSQVNATAVWDQYGTKGDGVKVAVLDTGVDASHPDIDLYTENESDPTYPGGWAEFDVDGNRVNDSQPYDSASHGTHVSGTVSGGNASGEYVGVAPNASLMHGLVLKGGSGSFAQIIAGMQWAVDNDADVISMSLGAGGYRSALIEPVRNAHQSGTVVVAAAGNNGDDSIGSPGAVYEAITVGSTGGTFVEDRSYNLSKVDPTAISSFSGGVEVDSDQNWGDGAPDSWPDTYVLPDVAAPGYGVKSSVPGDNYERKPGTSMATPHVSGVVALMLAASNESHSPGEVKSALYDSAWKPADCDPYCTYNANDTRYGTGIIDAYAATTQLVEGQTAITGAVEDSAGNPLSSADLEVDWKHVEPTDAGTFDVAMAPGNYTLTADAFGYQSGSTNVSLAPGETASTTLSLSKGADARQLSSMPDGFQAGTTATSTFEVANVESATIEVNGDYNLSEVTVAVNGKQVDQNGQVKFFEPQTGKVDASVTSPSDTTGNVSLKITFSGFGDSSTIQTNTTEVYKEPVSVAVVADDRWPHSKNHSRAEQLGTHLEEILPVNYEVEVIYGINNASAQIPEYDVFVVNDLSDDYEGINEFVDRTQRSDTGVVWLGQYGAQGSAVTEYSDATGSPETVGDTSGTLNPLALLFKPDEEAMDHPILDGVQRDFNEEYVKLNDGQTHHQWVKGADMDSLGIGAVAEDGFFGTTVRETHSIVAIDELERTAMLPALGYAYYMGNPDHPSGAREYTDAGDQILANTITWATEDSPVSMTTPAKKRNIGGGDDPDRSEPTELHGQPDHVTPGSNVTTTFEVNSLEELTVTVDSEFSSLAAENLTLYVNGEEAAFGEARTYDSLTDQSLTVTLETDENATGDVSLDYSFVAGPDNETINGSTGRTAVYDGLVRVPDDVDSLQEAIDLVASGDEIVVGNGTYDPVHVYSAGKHDVTLRAADGATPTIALKRGGVAPLRVTADRVTVSGFHIDASKSSFDAGVSTWSEHASDGERISIDDAPNSISSGFDDITLANLTVEGGEQGVWLTDNVPGIEVRNVSISGSETGVLIEKAPNATVAGVTVENTAIGVRAANPVVTPDENVKILGSHFANTDVGISIGGLTADTTVENNTIVDSTTGIEANMAAERNRITSNDIDATEGIRFTGSFQNENKLTNYRVTHNDIDATTGILMTKSRVADEGAIDPSSVNLRFNDLEGTNESINNTLVGTLDARLNYYGDNGPGTQTFSGPVVTEPFLTASPEMAAEGVNDLDSTPHWGIDVELEAGSDYTVGVPGPASGTVGEMFDEFEGVIYGFDESDQSWEQLTADDSVSSLDAMLVIPETDTRAVLSFAHDRDTPDAPDQHELTEGWNFVTSPEAADVSTAFGYATEEVTVVSNVYQQPSVDIGPQSGIEGTHHLGRDNPNATVSPFTGYFVFVEDDGYLPAYLGEDPTMGEFYEELGVERPNVSDTSMDAALDTTVPAAAQAAIDRQVRRAPAEYRDAVRTEVESAVQRTLANTTGLPTDERVKAIELAARQAAIDVLEDAAEDADSDEGSTADRDHIVAPGATQVGA
jgi:subtilisin family serine protease